MNTPIHAVFLVAPLGDDHLAGVIRPDGSIGLPGGKVDPGETWKTALIREAGEEGWQLPSSPQFWVLHRQEVEGRPVLWALLMHGEPTPTTPSAKDVARGVRPVPVLAHELQGFGNPEALANFHRYGGVQC